MRYVLDADILIGALDADDAHHDASRQLLTGWRAQQDETLVSIVNLSEVLVAPASDEHRLRVARAAIAALGVSVHRPSAAIGIDAARLGARYPISLPDAYLLATARRLDGVVASFDAKIQRAAAHENLATV